MIPYCHEHGDEAKPDAQSGMDSQSGTGIDQQAKPRQPQN